MAPVRRLVTRHRTWLLAAAVVTVAVVIITGWWLVAVYSLINVTGTVLYLDGMSPRSKRGRLCHRWFPVLAIVLLPVGIYGVLASNDSGPSEDLRGDPDLRNGFGGSVGQTRRRVEWHRRYRLTARSQSRPSIPTQGPPHGRRDFASV